MLRTHSYYVRIAWTGNRGSGTSTYRGYGREHEITVGEAAEADGAGDGHGARRPELIPGSADPAFLGDPGRWNPEQLLTAALAQCHMLWYLHLCAQNGVVVTGYTDDARGQMAEAADGSGRFTEVKLRPRVTVSSPDMAGEAASLHEAAHRKCFIANSVSFPVRCDPVVLVG